MSCSNCMCAECEIEGAISKHLPGWLEPIGTMSVALFFVCTVALTIAVLSPAGVSPSHFFIKSMAVGVQIGLVFFITSMTFYFYLSRLIRRTIENTKEEG